MFHPKYKAADQHTLDLLCDYRRSAWGTKEDEILFDWSNDTLIMKAMRRSEIVADSTHKLNEDFYYSPGGYPRLSGGGSTGVALVDKYFPHKRYRNTAWWNWSVANNNIHYSSNSDSIHLTPVTETPISVEEYTEIFYEEMELQLLKIYNKNKPVVLMYSGSIDSLVILSFIIRLGFLDKTRLVYVENQALGIKSINKSVEYSLGLNVEHRMWTSKNLLTYLNSHCPWKSAEYSDIWCLEEYPDSIIIVGMGGNRIALHSPIHFCKGGVPLVSDADTLYGGSEEFSNELLKTPFMDYNDDFDTYHNTSTLNRESGYDIDRHCIFYNTSKRLMDSYRRLDFSGYSGEYWADAQFAKQVIKNNAGVDLLDVCRSRTGGEWSSPAPYINIRDIDPEFLQIHLAKGADTNGVRWLKQELAQAHISGVIEHHTLKCLKFTNWLTNPVIRESTHSKN